MPRPQAPDDGRPWLQILQERFERDERYMNIKAVKGPIKAPAEGATVIAVEWTEKHCLVTWTFPVDAP